MSQDFGIIPVIVPPPEWTPADVGNAAVRGGKHEQTNLSGRGDGGAVFEEKSADLASFAIGGMKPELKEVAVTELGDVRVPRRLADGVDLDRIARLGKLCHGGIPGSLPGSDLSSPGQGHAPRRKRVSSLALQARMMQVRGVSPEAEPREHEPAIAIDTCHGRSPRRLDWILAFVAALILSDAFDETLYVLFGWQARLVRGVPIARIPLIVVAAVAAILLTREPRDTAAHLRGAWWLWPAVVLAFVSALWSERPEVTLVWAAALFATSAFGVALAVRFSALAQALLVVAVTTAIALASVVSAAVWPSHAVSDGQWRGIYAHRMTFGRTQAMGVGAAPVTILSQRHRVISAGALFLCAILLLATQSRASELAAAVTVFATPLLLAARRWRPHARTILMAGTTAALLVLTLLLTTRSGLALLARSETFTDRTMIWKSVAAIAMEKPWLGHGYGAFWKSAAGDAAWAGSGVRNRINHAHNGGLDLFAELGIAGIALVFVPLAMVAVTALRHALAPRHPACLWPAVYLVFFVVSNVAESALLRHKLFWALYVAAACHVATAARTPLTTRKTEP